jgi:protein SCO1
VSTPGERAGLANAPFSLIDHHGRAVTLETYRGRYLLLFFGFTLCRVVCPRNLQRIERALARLGPVATRVQPLYVTVDPARDSPAVMKSFLERNYPHFTGLTGSAEQIEAIKCAYRVFARRKEVETDPDGYTMPHTAFTYVIGPAGEYLAHFTDGVDEAQLALCLQSLIEPEHPL